MNISEKYLKALNSFDDWVIVSEWAERVGEQNPELLEKANREAENQANDTTGLRELAARIRAPQSLVVPMPIGLRLMPLKNPAKSDM